MDISKVKVYEKRIELFLSSIGFRFSLEPVRYVSDIQEQNTLFLKDKVRTMFSGNVDELALDEAIINVLLRVI